MDVGGMRNDDGMDADMRGCVKGLDDATTTWTAD